MIADIFNFDDEIYIFNDMHVKFDDLINTKINLN